MLETNIDEIRAAAGSAVGMTVIGGRTGPPAVELDYFIGWAISPATPTSFNSALASLGNFLAPFILIG